MKQTPNLRHLLNNRAIFFIFLVFYLGVNNIKINFATKYTIHVINNRLNIILMRKNCILNLSKMSKSLLVLAMLLFAVVENASAQLPSFKLKNIEGKTYGQMLLQLPENEGAAARMLAYLESQHITYTEEEVK